MNLVQIIKKAAMDAVNASYPADILFGEVVSISPLSIKIDQKFTLDENFLTLTSLVRDIEVEQTVEGETTTAVLHFALAVGEKVILIRANGGQKFIVLDRVR